MKVSEIQQTIFEQTGIRTSVKRGTGSMKGYVTFSPMFQGGEYLKFPLGWRRAFKQTFPVSSDKPMFVDDHQINIFHGVEIDEPTRYKRESKPTVGKARTWGSANSQLRLDKASARYGKRVRRGDNTVKF